jgi:hypothetical protein
MAALSINDGLATPGAHTFAVDTTNGRKASWNEKTAGVAVGYFPLSHEYRPATTPTGANRVLINLSTPRVATVDGTQKRVSVSSAQVVFNFAQDATLQERKDLLAYISNYLADATAKAAIYNNDSWF